MFLCFLQVRLFNERQWHFALTSSVAILKSGISSYAGISLASFDHQRKPKRSFFAPTFEDQKSVQYKEKWAVDVIRNWQAAREKSYSFTPAGECFQSVQSLEERLEDLHQSNEHLFKCRIPSLSDFQTQVIVYPNTYFCIYKIFI